MAGDPYDFCGESGLRGDTDCTSGVFSHRLSPDVLDRYEGPEQIADVLRMARELSAQATLCGAQISQPVTGTFAAIVGDRIVLSLDCDDSTLIGLRTLCTVIFTHNKRQCVFFSVVLAIGLQHSDGKRDIAIRIPTRIDEVEARWNRRTSVPSSISAKAKIALPNGQILVAEVQDLGRGGADLKFAQGDANLVPFGRQATLVFEVENFMASLTAELRWRNGDRCGFCFDHFHGRSVLAVPEAFEKILKFVDALPDSEAA